MLFIVDVDNEGFKVYDSSGTLIDPAKEGTLDDVKSILTAIRDTAGVKKITDALPAGTNWLGKVQLGNGTNVVGVTNDGGVYRLEIYGKVRRADGTVINPATEETLTTVDAKLATIDAVLDSIKDTDGIKKITDALPTGDNIIGRTKVTDGTNTANVVDDDGVGRLAVDIAKPATSSSSNVALSTSSTTLLAANSDRLGAAIFNDSNKSLYVKLGASASSTSFTVEVPKAGYYEIPFGYTGIVDGALSQGTGTARVTELT